MSRELLSKRFACVGLAVSGLLLSGCVQQGPRSAAEVRQDAVEDLCSASWDGRVGDAADAERVREIVYEHTPDESAQIARALEVADSYGCPGSVPRFTTLFDRTGTSWDSETFTDDAIQKAAEEPAGDPANAAGQEDGVKADTDRAEPKDANAPSSGYSIMEPDLEALGMTPMDIRTFGLTIDETGYADPLDMLVFDEAQQYVYVALDACERVATGAETFESLMATDVAAGAPPADARAFYRYLANDFCYWLPGY